MTTGNAVRVAQWLTLNVGFFGLLGAWHFYSQYWALNLFTFGFWLMVVVSLLVVSTEPGRAAARKRGRSAPAWLSNAFDIAMICVLAAWGWFWMASFWFIQMCAQAAIYDDDKAEAA